MPIPPTIESHPASPGSASASLLALVLGCAPTGCDRASSEAPPGADAEAAQGTKNATGPKTTPDPKTTSDPRATARTNATADADPATPRAPTEPPPPAGWRRLELSTLVPALTGTLDLPPGITAEATLRQELDADGLDAEARSLQLGPKVGGATVGTMADIPARFASADAMATFHSRFELVSTHDHGPDHWAVVQRGSPGECMLHGWSAAAGLTCDVSKAPCDEMAQWVQICGTLRPGPTPNESPTTPASAFPKLQPAAATLAITVAQAIARNDAPMLLAAIGPAGVKIGKETHSAKSLEAAVTGKWLLKVVAPRYAKFALEDGSNEGMLGWNADAPEGGKAKVRFSSGYGEQPYFVMKKNGDAWVVTEFGIEDLGEP